MKWLLKSNRLKHFLYAIPIGFIFTILCVLGVATSLEYKDILYGGKWDWIDWLLTITGGIIGQAIQLLIIILIAF